MKRARKKDRITRQTCIPSGSVFNTPAPSEEHPDSFLLKYRSNLLSNVQVEAHQPANQLTMSAIAIQVLAVARCGVGIALLALPQTTARIFMLPTAASSTLIFRLAGSRDLALGGLLWSASASAQPPSSYVRRHSEPRPSWPPPGAYRWRCGGRY